jgi:hypothetical protein
MTTTAGRNIGDRAPPIRASKPLLITHWPPLKKPGPHLRLRARVDPGPPTRIGLPVQTRRRRHDNDAIPRVRVVLPKISGLLRRLWRPPSVPHPFRPLSGLGVTMISPPGILPIPRATQPPIPLTKRADGVWTVTVAPLEPNIYSYGFLVGEVRTTDPSCRCNRTGIRDKSLCGLRRISEKLFGDASIRHLGPPEVTSLRTFGRIGGEHT